MSEKNNSTEPERVFTIAEKIVLGLALTLATYTFVSAAVVVFGAV